jgi:hypothetical protein
MESGGIHIFGIRHHGPGSARSLQQALETLQPDCVLVEGPPDAAGVLPLLAHEDMRAPVALLIYRPDQPRRAVYYPFAVFSPEWRAIHYALTNDVPVRFMDLPQAHGLADPLPGENEDEQSTPPESPVPGDEAPPKGDQTPEETPAQAPSLRVDPLRWLAEAAGYSDSERWWEHMVEQRQSSVDLFAAILEAMTALRQFLVTGVPNSSPAPDDPLEIRHEARREAYMRQTIRAAQKEGFARIAVVCGAWHGPALADMPPAREDAALLKDLPTTKVQATWVPWTYGRLSYNSGYGAGIHSPGWYHHLWTTHEHVTVSWVSRVAQLLREQDLDASSAHVIETVRTAEALAALRDRPAVGLAELNEATQAVLCFGSDAPMRLIHDKLIVGETLGGVPAETPMVPLQLDMQKEQKRLRLPVEASSRPLDLDLRNSNDLDKSYLLHRLSLLGVAWGRMERTWGKKGTFHELWTLQWQPELVVSLIEAGIWGNTVEDAAAGHVRHAAERAENLPDLTRLVDSALLANLSTAVPDLMSRLQEEAALSSDVAHLMQALPPLANVLRYSNVRRTDVGMVSHVVDGLVARICIGLPGAVASLSDEAAAEMFSHIMAAHEVITLLQNSEYSRSWQDVLRQLADQNGLHGLIAGRACRILLDAGDHGEGDTARRMALALSPAVAPTQAAAWIEGFLKGSGLVLLHDRALLALLDDWLTGLSADNFAALLPLVRRTFSTFAPPERRQIGTSIAARRSTLLPDPEQSDSLVSTPSGRGPDFDTARAEAVLPLVAQLLGLESSRGSTDGR